MKDSNMKTFSTTILLGLSLLTALTLEAEMTSGFIAELVLILIGAILTGGILFGIWIEEEWVYPAGMLLFAAFLANLLWLFFATKIFLTFAFGLLVNVAGLVICLVSTEKTIWEELETYDLRAAKKKRK